MTESQFDPTNWRHWLLIAAFLGLSTWVIWQAYFQK